MIYGVLTVVIRNAHFEKDKDIGSKMDPYIVLKVGEQKQQTKVAEAAGKNANFNTMFTFNINNNEHELKISAFDKDPVGNDKLGNHTINFSKILKGGQMSETARLSGALRLLKKGEVRVDLSFKAN